MDRALDVEKGGGVLDWAQPGAAQRPSAGHFTFPSLCCILLENKDGSNVSLRGFRRQEEMR